MGATLPTVARWVETTPAGVSWLGYFYGGNIAGAVCGCLLAGFYLLRVYDTAAATTPPPQSTLRSRASRWRLRRSHLAAGHPRRSSRTRMCRTGASTSSSACRLCALAAEVIWTRLLASFSGLRLHVFDHPCSLSARPRYRQHGSVILCRHVVADAAAALGVCQLLLAGAIAWTAYLVGAALPYWPIAPSISSIWFNFQLDITRAFLALFRRQCSGVRVFRSRSLLLWPAGAEGGWREARRRRLCGQHRRRHRRRARRQPPARRLGWIAARAASADGDLRDCGSHVARSGCGV
jgi:spermidine synthase